jgi:hypothetical protein
MLMRPSGLAARLTPSRHTSDMQMLIRRTCIRAVAVWMTAGFLMASPVLSQAGIRNPASSVKADSSAALKKDFQKRFSHMSKRYKLTATQQVQLRSILLKEQQDQQTVFADSYMSRKDKREEQAKLFEASQQKIRVILTIPQRHKFDADERRRAWMDGRLPNPNPGPPF